VYNIESNYEIYICSILMCRF